LSALRNYGITGLINSSVLRREPVEDGISRVAEELPGVEINEDTTIDLIRKTTLYKRKFNGLTGDYEGPEHKTESHAADSLRYTFCAIEQEFDKQTGEFMYSPSMAQDTYATDDLTVASAYNPSY